jgi:hypothetical protein
MSRVPRRTGALTLVRGAASDGGVVSLNAEAARENSEIPGRDDRS